MRRLLEITITWSFLKSLQLQACGRSASPLRSPVLRSDTTQTAGLLRYPPIFFKASSLSINRIRVLDVFFGSSLGIGEIHLTDPELVLFVNQPTTEQPSEENKAADLIQYIDINKLTIEKGSLQLYDFTKPADTLYFGNDILIMLTDIHIPTQSPVSLYKASTIGNISFNMQSVRFNPSNIPYSFAVDSISIDRQADIFETHGIDLLPAKSRLRLSREQRYQKTFADVHLDMLKIVGLDYEALQDDILSIEEIQIKGGLIDLFRNRQKDLNTGLDKKTIQEGLRSIPLQLDIHRVRFEDIDLKVALLNPAFEEPAVINLSKGKGTWKNINTKSDTAVIMHVSLDAIVMKSGKLKFEVDLPVLENTNSYRGIITDMPFEEWNQVINHFSSVEIEAGEIQEIKFAGVADAKQTSGEMTFRYTGLKAGYYQSSEKIDRRKSRIISFIGNLLIKNDNPKKAGETPVSVKYTFERADYQGPTMLWIGGLLRGLELTILGEKIVAEIDKRRANKP